MLDRFRADGCRVAEIGEAPEAEAMRATLEAIRGGTDVVYQGTRGGADRVLFAPADGRAGIRPRWMHLAPGNGQFSALETGGYAACGRQARRLPGAFVAAGGGENPPSVPYPESAEHCAICRWSEFCAQRRRRDDDLSLIAGITAGQRRTLKAAGAGTMRGFAGLAELPPLDRTSRESLRRAQSQARLQVASEDAGRSLHERAIFVK